MPTSNSVISVTVAVAWLFGARRVVLSVSESADSHAQPTLEFTQNGVKKTETICRASIRERLV